MPHCILECSDNIVENVNKKELLLQVNNRLAETGLFNLNDIKSRFVVHEDYFIGDGDVKRAFVTLNVAILSGRSQETRNMISNNCLDFLKSKFIESFKELKFSLTVQISEMDKESYAKEKNY
jgi:5-carboxymethyl-2-hydroxymuconate isomerase